MSDELDDLLGPRRRPSEPAHEAASPGDARDDVPPTPTDTASEPMRRRPTGAQALDAILAGGEEHASGSAFVPDATPDPNRRVRWERALSWTMAVLGFSGMLADAVAASQLLADNGPNSLAIVWAIGGATLLATAAFQSSRIDRHARLTVLKVLFSAVAVLFVAALVLFATDVTTVVPAGLSWLLADQLNFLLPLLVWALAGDIFSAGDGVTVFPRISRWFLGGQIAGLAVAAASPLAFDAADLDLAWLLVLAVVLCGVVARIVPRRLADASASAGHQRNESVRSAIRNTVELVRDLPAFHWLWRMSLAAMVAGAMVEFLFFREASLHLADAGDLQMFYAGISLVGFLLCWVIQSTVTTSLLNRRGIPAVLGIVPIATLVGALVMFVAVTFVDAAAASSVLAAIGILAWRLPRWSVDSSARQAALATVPDERRARVSFLTELVPWSIGLVLVAVPIVIAEAFDAPWVVAVIAALLGLVGTMLSRRIITTWEDTQLSYKLKRRKRLT